jgi:hypothetical protein
MSASYFVRAAPPFRRPSDLISGHDVVYRTCTHAGYVKQVILSYDSSPDVSVLKLHVDDEGDQSNLPEGVTSHTQTVYLLLPEGMSGKDLMSGAHIKVSVDMHMPNNSLSLAMGSATAEGHL